MDLDSLHRNVEDEENNEDEEDDDDEGGNENNEDEIDDGSTNNDPNQCTNRGSRQPLNFSLHYKNVEDSIRPFDGSDKYPVERWIAEFEDASKLFGWSELQKLIFEKKSLTGIAKLFIQSEYIINTWKTLKAALIEEFSKKINSQ